jgi:hypothetical protein
VFVALCLVVSPVNLPAHSAIAAVSIDDVPGEFDGQAATASRSAAVHEGARRVRRRLSAPFRCGRGLDRAWARCRALGSTFSGLPPPGRRGPPLLA